MNLFGKYGGYRKLDSFTLASVIQLATWRFCNTFLNRRNDPTGRQFDQMTQSARSGRVNIAEGSERASTSTETEHFGSHQPSTRSLYFTPTHIANRAPIFIPCRLHRQ